MTAPNEFLDDDTDTGSQTGNESGSALRRFANEQKKRADEMEKQLREMQATIAKRDAESVFQELGINEKIRKFYSGDLTKDAIAGWWKENAELFGVDPTAGDPTLTDEQKQTQAEMNGLQQAAQLGQERNGAVSADAFKQARSDLLSQGKTLADLDEVLAKMGVPNMPLVAPQF